PGTVSEAAKRALMLNESQDVAAPIVSHSALCTLIVLREWRAREEHPGKTRLNGQGCAAREWSDQNAAGFRNVTACAPELSWLQAPYAPTNVPSMRGREGERERGYDKARLSAWFALHLKGATWHYAE
ncbi:unnamed protein product, partial [Pleuronectes platessa]